MKIAHIAPPWLAIPPQNYGGTETVIFHLIEEQVAQGHEVMLLAPSDAKTAARVVSFYDKSLVDSGVPWSAHLKAYYHLHQSVEYVKKHQFDILHTHLSSAADMYLFPLTAHLSTPLSTPHVMTIHSSFPFDRIGSWIGDADRYYLEWAAGVPMVAISQSACAQLPSGLNVVSVVHHGVPMEHFVPTVNKPDEFYAWLGRIVPDKGPHLAIEAARKAGVPLVLAGIVDSHVPEAVRYFREFIEPQIDGSQITYIGPVAMSQKIDLLSRARAFLNPIQWEEPFGMVMIEAMAVGCPVITFPRGAAPEIVVDGQSGFFANDVDEMVSCIRRIEMLDRSMVRACAEAHFSVRVMAEQYLALYRKVRADVLLRARPSMTVVASTDDGKEAELVTL
jgi:glycosyltransferase involved in cell wall biosynthesis